ncbi:MAG: hypothetical protein R3286_14810 [Gammaproteobacteria bacterium]|nr:hypothetical protein [Gammaproteobacteria bacterium]
MNEIRKPLGIAAGHCACALAAILAAGAGMLAPSAAYSQQAAGNLAATIRESGNPCSHVVEAEQTGDNSYKVRCNSGTFNVTMNADGTAQVTRAD